MNRVAAFLRTAAIVACAVGAAAFFSSGTLSASPTLGQAGERGRVPVRVVGQKLVVSCDVSSSFRRIPVNLFVELETPCGLQLHNRAAFPLRAEAADGTPRPLRIHLPGLEIDVDKREHGDEELLEDFTKYWSKELGENAVVGTIGSEILSRYHLTFDLGAGLLWLEAPHARGAGLPDAPPGGVTVPITDVNGLVWLPVRYAGGKPAALALGTVRYDSLIDERVAEFQGYPAGNIEKLEVGELDLAKRVAFRPEEVIQVHPDGVAGVAGINLLEGLRVEIDRVNRWARIEPTGPARFPSQDVVFFTAMVDEDAAAVEAFLEDYPGARLAHEAAELLLELRLSEVATSEECAGAVRWMFETTPKDLRTTRMLDLLLELANRGETELVVAAGELGIDAGREDRYPNAVHEVHAKLGEVLLEADEGRRAWKHLLSAAFGLPEDGMVNLNLGRYYEREGRYRRAFSRFVQAAIRPESGPSAIEALQRVQRELGDEEPFSVGLVERMTEGKVRNFGAPTTFEADEATDTGRVVLCEFFTNAHYGNEERGGAIGGALGNQGLWTHFTGGEVAFLSYHLVDPQPDPLCNALAERAAWLSHAENPNVHVINGVTLAPGAGKWRDAEAIYKRVRDAIVAELEVPSEYELELEAAVEHSVEGDEVAGTLRVFGPKSGTMRAQLVLAEEGVLFPGKSGVLVHRMVARAQLTEQSGGERIEPEDGVFEYDFRASLQEIAAKNEAYLDELEADGVGSIVRMSTSVDPREVRLVAFVRNVATGEVVQALQYQPDGTGERRP